MLLLGLVWVGAISCRREPPPSVPLPSQLERLEPQLRAYIQEHVQPLRAAPWDAQRHATLGLIYAANGLWSEAYLAFSNAVRLKAQFPLAGLYLGLAAQESGRLTEAIEQFTRLTQECPQFAPAQFHLGDALLRAGRTDQAEAPFRRLTELVPSEWRGFAGLGDIKVRQGNYAEAVRLLEQAVRLDPNAKIAHHLLGLAYRGLGRLAEAERELHLGLDAVFYPIPNPWSEAMTRHVKLLHEQIEVAQQLALSGRPEDAVTLLEETRRWHPDNASVLSNLGFAYHQAGQADKARSILLKAVALNDRHLNAWVFLTESCLELNLVDEALAHANRALEVAPQLPQSHLAKANVFFAQGRHADALEELKSAHRCDPQNPAIALDIGDTLARLLGRPAEALEYYERATTVDPTSLEGWLRLADLQVQLGHPAAARKALEAARPLAPNEAALAAIRQRLEALPSQ
jgi:tetratricopeptide (TPR) repeat protein